jgi:6-phosphofructokinase 1
MRIGVFCSGGDAPGMNACLRAVVRAAVGAGHEVIGIRRGYQGLLDEDFYVHSDGQPRMPLRSVSDILRWGGTIIRTSRCQEFFSDEGQQKAAAILQKHKVDALLPIGGDGTFRGAVALARYWPGQVIGCPGTIDNDLIGSDYTIGFHTAVGTAVDAVDKLRDTAASHERLFIIEVMGRHSGYIALYTALMAGAEIACLPETVATVDAINRRICELKGRGKSSLLVIVAEGDETGGAMRLHEQLKATSCPFSTRVVILGHVQRGGSPSPVDRLLGSRLGDFAVRSILAGHSGAMAGEVGGKLLLTPLADTFAAHRPVPLELIELLDRLSR